MSEYECVDSVETLTKTLERVKNAQKEFSKYSQEQVDKIFQAAAIAANEARIPLAKMAVEETGMGFSNQGMPEQRAIGSGMVQATGDHTNYILSLGARSTVCCWQHGTAGRTGQGCLCKSADAKAGMPQRSRTFRYAVCRECENGYLSVVWEGAAENIG